MGQLREFLIHLSKLWGKLDWVLLKPVGSKKVAVFEILKLHAFDVFVVQKQKIYRIIVWKIFFNRHIMISTIVCYIIYTTALELWLRLHFRRHIMVNQDSAEWGWNQWVEKSVRIHFSHFGACMVGLRSHPLLSCNTKQNGQKRWIWRLQASDWDVNEVKGDADALHKTTETTRHSL